MSGGTERADGSALAASHLQPAEPSRRSSRSSEELDRLLGDSNLLLRLQLSGYSPKEWEPVATEFARYGLAVLSAWIGNGRIFQEVKKVTKIALVPHEGGFNHQDREDLATDTVVAALPAFLEVLKAKRWDPTKGASLKTYFVGQCKWQFPNVYKRWQRMNDRPSPPVVGVDLSDVHESRLRPAAAADTSLLAAEKRAEALAVLTTDKARRAFTLLDMGYNHEEIADEIGVADEKAVENLLGYQRRHAQEQAKRRAQ